MSTNPVSDGDLFHGLDSSGPSFDTGAVFSECRRYRYRLWRRWSPGKRCMFLMLNPSTADETANDPTVERCQRRAVKMGFGSLEVANIFALRSTDPRALYECDDPIGAGNNDAIMAAAFDANLIICAWGSHGSLNDRGAEVLKMLRDAGYKPHALRINADGTPAHPLYLPYSLSPELMV